MKLLICGHSYAADLERFCVNQFEVDSVVFELSYVHRRGATYDTLLRDEGFWNDIDLIVPDYILVILGGNSIKCHVSNLEIYKVAREFYSTLKGKHPDATIISAQIELRFYKLVNRWNCPSGDDYLTRRVAVNNFIKRLTKLDNKHHILQVGGDCRLDNRELYRDEIHLNDSGLLRYYNYIRRTLKYILRVNIPRNCFDRKRVCVAHRLT